MIYLASPYTHKFKSVMEKRFQQVSKYAAHMLTKKRIVFSPIAYTHPLNEYADLPYDWEYWWGFNKAFLSESKELWVLCLPGWEISDGVKVEIEFAKEHNIPITFVLPKGLTVENLFIDQANMCVIGTEEIEV